MYVGLYNLLVDLLYLRRNLLYQKSVIERERESFCVLLLLLLLLLLKTTNLACRELKLQNHVHKLSLRSVNGHSEK